MRIKSDRLKDYIIKMGEVGATPKGGISRLALSQSDKSARDLLVYWMKESNLDVKFDDVGNIYGRREGTNPKAKPIVIGSHLDSIINGGKFDGILGIACGLEIIKTLDENGISTNKPIEIVNFTDEEGVRFDYMLTGSGVLSGEYTIEEVYQQIDEEQFYFLDELKSIGYLGSKENRLQEAEAFLELHIEQGPILDAEKTSLGVVKGTIGFTWLEVTVEGEAENSGPTPMSYRKDALRTAAKMISMAYKLDPEISDKAIVTVGKINSEPGSINTIPGKVKFTLDIRAEKLQMQIDAVNLIEKNIKKVAKNDGLDLDIKKMKSVNPHQFDSELINTLKQSIEELNYNYKNIVSGASHIARFMNDFCPTAMIFVPSINGSSHSPKEKTDWKDIEKATNLILRTVINIDTK